MYCKKRDYSTENFLLTPTCEFVSIAKTSLVF